MSSFCSEHNQASTQALYLPPPPTPSPNIHPAPFSHWLPCRAPVPPLGAPLLLLAMLLTLSAIVQPHLFPGESQPRWIFTTTVCYKHHGRSVSDRRGNEWIYKREIMKELAHGAAVGCKCGVGVRASLHEGNFAPKPLSDHIRVWMMAIIYQCEAAWELIDLHV